MGLTHIIYHMCVYHVVRAHREVRVGMVTDNLEARAGIEPAHSGFADRRVTTSPSGRQFDDTNF
jgi:hypothetical protein